MNSIPASAEVRSPARDLAIWSGLLIALYLLAVVLISGRTLIGTEVWALFYAGKPLAEHMEAVRQDLVHPPLMYLLHRIWIGLFGASDTSVKLLPVVVNIPALVLFAALANRLTVHWRAVSFCFCLLYAGARVPATTRMYGLGLLLTILALWLWNLWENEPNWRRLLAWSIVMGLLVYTHFFGLLLLAGFVTAVLLLGPKRLPFLAASITIALTWLPWFLFVMPVYQERGVETNLWWVQVFSSNPVIALLLLPVSLLGDLPSGRFLRPLLLVALAIHGALLLGAILASRRRLLPPLQWRTPEGRIWGLLAITSVPVLLLFVFSVLRTPALHMRFLLGIVPSYWLLLGVLAQQAKNPGRLILYFLVIPWAVVSGAYSLQSTRPVSDQHLAAASMLPSVRPTDLVVCSGDCNSFFWEWTQRMRGTTPIRFIYTGNPASRASQQTGRLSVVPPVDLTELPLKQYSRIWVVTHDSSALLNASEGLMNAGFRRESVFSKGAVAVAQFTRSGV